MDTTFKDKIEKMYTNISEQVEKLEFREAVLLIIGFLDEANKYYDERKPWIQTKEDISGFNDTIYTCSNIIANISNFIEPFMPGTAMKIREYLHIDKATWNYIEVTPNLKLENINPLFERMK